MFCEETPSFWVGIGAETSNNGATWPPIVGFCEARLGFTFCPPIGVGIAILEELAWFSWSIFDPKHHF